MIINAAKATQAAGILGVELATLNPDILAKAYRAAAKLCHPDMGNYDAKKWADVSWAKEVLTRVLTNQPRDVTKPHEQPTAIKGDCRACAGTGRVQITKRKGFGAKPMTMMCVMCHGSGNVVTEPHRANNPGD